MRFLCQLLLFVFVLSCNTADADKGDKKKKGKKKDQTRSKLSMHQGLKELAQLPSGLKEVSGLAADGSVVWAVSDNPKEPVYKLDQSGKVLEQLPIKSVDVSNIEDIAVDETHIYIGDVGDNNGKRATRKILKLEKNSIAQGNARVEVIEFSFSGQGDGKPKNNNFDCEAFISYRDKLYLFTKRRGDNKTEIFELSKNAGVQTPRSLGVFDTKGMITGAAVNHGGSEIALVGYQDGHRQPFILLLTDFTGTRFFSGKQNRIQLTDDNTDWQIESVTYKDKRTLYIACEETKDVASTLYEFTLD